MINSENIIKLENSMSTIGSIRSVLENYDELVDTISCAEYNKKVAEDAVEESIKHLSAIERRINALQVTYDSFPKHRIAARATIIAELNRLKKLMALERTKISDNRFKIVKLQEEIEKSQPLLEEIKIDDLVKTLKHVAANILNLANDLNKTDSTEAEME